MQRDRNARNNWSILRCGFEVRLQLPANENRGDLCLLTLAITCLGLGTVPPFVRRDGRRMGPLNTIGGKKKPALLARADSFSPQLRYQRCTYMSIVEAVAELGV